MCGYGFGLESAYVYEFGGRGAREGCGELGVVRLRRGKDCILVDWVMFIVITGGVLLLET